MVGGLLRAEEYIFSSPPRKKKEKTTRKIKISYKGYRVSQMARHLAQGKQKITSGKVFEKNAQDVLEWINGKRHLPQPPTQLQQYPS
jgi:hypothetical protein